MRKSIEILRRLRLPQWIGFLLLLGCAHGCGNDEDSIDTDVDVDPDIEIVEEDYLKFQAFSPLSENILPSIEGPFEEHLNSPGAAVKIDGSYYLFYNDYVNGWPPSDVRIGLARSVDMVSWERVPEIILSGENVSYLNGTSEHPSVSSIVVEEDGSIKMYFDIFINGNGRGVGLATAPDINGPWSAHPQPVLTPSGGGWDRYGIASSDVIRVDGSYHMYYAVFMDERANPEMGIGMATSENGIDWEKHPDAVFRKSSEEAWDSFKVEVPRVIHTNKGFVMAYRSDDGHPSWGGNSGYGIAISEDGINWERFQQKAVVHEAYFPWATLWACAFMKEDEQYFMFLETDGPPAPGTRVNIVTYDGDFFD